MYQEFFTKTIESKFIKNILHNTPLPKYKSVRVGDYVTKDHTYIYGENVIYTLSSGFLGEIPEYDISNFSEEDLVLATYDGIGKYVFGESYPKITETFIPNDGYYDTDTHEVLGNYLRCVRNLYGMDLMPFYNCYSGRQPLNLHINKITAEKEVDVYKWNTYKEPLIETESSDEKQFKNISRVIASKAVRVSIDGDNRYVYADGDSASTEDFKYKYITIIYKNGGRSDCYYIADETIFTFSGDSASISGTYKIITCNKSDTIYESITSTNKGVYPENGWISGVRYKLLSLYTWEKHNADIVCTNTDIVISPLPDRRSKLPYGYANCSAVECSGYLYIFGDSDGTVYRYDGEEWGKYSDTITAPAWGRGKVSKGPFGRFYLFYNKKLYEFTPSNGFKTINNTCPLYSGTCLYTDDGIYVFGSSSSYYVYSNKKWSAYKPPFTFYGGFVFLHNGNINIITKGTTSSNPITHRILVNNSWVEDIRIKRIGLTSQQWNTFIGCGDAVVLNDEIHLFCGTDHYVLKGSAKWKRRVDLPYNFSNGSAVVYNDNIHLIGGTGNSYNHFIYNNGVWERATTGNVPCDTSFYKLKNTVSISSVIKEDGSIDKYKQDSWEMVSDQSPIESGDYFYALYSDDFGNLDDTSVYKLSDNSTISVKDDCVILTNVQEPSAIYEYVYSYVNSEDISDFPNGGYKSSGAFLYYYKRFGSKSTKSKYKMLDISYDIVESPSSRYKTIQVPIKYNKTYTIAIDEDCDMLFVPALIKNSHKLYAYDSDGYKVDLSSELTYSVKKVHGSSFRKPFNFRACLLGSNKYSNLLENSEKYLCLLIQVPIDNNSSIVVLEGDYIKDDFCKKLYDLDYILNCSDYERDQTLLGMLSLLKINTKKSYAFSDRLIEYLTKNVICGLDEIGDNIYLAQNSQNEVPMRSMSKGVWEDSLRCVYFDKMSNNEFSNKHDINGLVDKDVEKLYIK